MQWISVYHLSAGCVEGQREGVIQKDREGGNTLEFYYIPPSASPNAH